MIASIKKIIIFPRLKKCFFKWKTIIAKYDKILGLWYNVYPSQMILCGFSLKKMYNS